MRQSLTAGACALILVSAAVAPLAAQNREERAHMQMAAELRMLLEQQQNLALAISGLNQSLTDAMKTLNGRLDALDNGLKKLFADQGILIGNIGTEVRGINQRSQDTITRLGELKEEVESLRQALLSLASRPIGAAPADPFDPNAPGPNVSQIPPIDAPASALGLSAKRLFDQGFADYASGNFAAAIQSWEQLLKSWATSEWADDAQFNIGEAEFQQRRFEQAIAAYNLVIQNHPKGDQVAGAYYKLGVAHENLGRFDSARAAWQELLKRYPNSTESGLAKQGLNRIDKTVKP